MDKTTSWSGLVPSEAKMYLDTVKLNAEEEAMASENTNKMTVTAVQSLRERYAKETGKSLGLAAAVLIVFVYQYRLGLRNETDPRVQLALEAGALTRISNHGVSAQAQHGHVRLVGDVTAGMSRQQALQLIVDLALAYSNSGDLCEPPSVEIVSASIAFRDAMQAAEKKRQALLAALRPFANLSTEDVDSLGLEQEVLDARALIKEQTE